MLTPTLSSDAKEFILAEYQRVGAELMANESAGDARVATFVGLWTLGTGAGVNYVFLARGAPGRDGQGHAAQTETGRDLAGAGMGLVILLGVLSLAWMIKRNLKTDVLIDTLVRFRYLVLSSLSGERRVLALVLPQEWIGESSEPKLEARRRNIFKVGLVPLTAVLNAIAVGTFVAIWWPPHVWTVALTFPLAAFLAQGGVYYLRYESRKRQRVRCMQAFEKEFGEVCRVQAARAAERDGATVKIGHPEQARS
jgi:hypothetical protein